MSAARVTQIRRANRVPATAHHDRDRETPNLLRTRFVPAKAVS